MGEPGISNCGIIVADLVVVAATKSSSSPPPHKLHLSAFADDNNNSAGEVDESLPRRFTDHTYHDFSNYIKEGGKLKKHKKSESNFPARLHAMLSDEQYSHIITWMVSFRELVYLLFWIACKTSILTMLHPYSGLPLLFLYQPTPYRT